MMTSPECATSETPAAKPEVLHLHLCLQVADFGISRAKEPFRTYINTTCNIGTPPCAVFPTMSN